MPESPENYSRLAWETSGRSEKEKFDSLREMSKKEYSERVSGLASKVMEAAQQLQNDLHDNPDLQQEFATRFGGLKKEEFMESIKKSLTIDTPPNIDPDEDPEIRILLKEMGAPLAIIRRTKEKNGGEFSYSSNAHRITWPASDILKERLNQEERNFLEIVHLENELGTAAQDYRLSKELLGKYGVNPENPSIFKK